MKLLWLAVLVLHPSIAGAAAETALPAQSLDEVYQAALKRAENLTIQQEEVNLAQERYRQALSNLYPSVTAQASYTRQDPVGGGTLGSIFPESQSSVKISAVQPLFRGFRDFAALKVAGFQKLAQEENFLQARVQLFRDVVDNFFQILTLEQELINISTEADLYRTRIDELRQRAKIGRSKISEVLTVESALALLNAQAEGIRGQLAANREVFSFLTGLKQQTALKGPKTEQQLEPMEAYLSTLQNRPDIRSARNQNEAAAKFMPIARGEYWPSVDLTGNYYPVRSGPLEDSHWDVGLNLTWTLFSGMSTQSNIRAAASQLHQSDLNLTRVLRQAEEDIRSNYSNVVADQASIAALTEAKNTAEKNYFQQVRDYRFGLVTNLDVLQSLTVFQTSQRALDRAGFKSRADFLKLEAAAARRPHGRESPGENSNDAL